MTRKKLPIGVQTFRKIRDGNHYYVDKTPFILDLIEEGSYYFLSRPRRFGKSLLVDTIQNLFEGSRDLFVGLAAENRWDWSVSHPVLKFSFGGGGGEQPGWLADQSRPPTEKSRRPTWVSTWLSAGRGPSG
jgi:hypothetical protein